MFRGVSEMYVLMCLGLTYPAEDRYPFEALFEYDEDVTVHVHEIRQAPDIPPIRVDLQN